MLLAVGYFISGPEDADLPAPQELVRPGEPLGDVADYLDRGLKHRGYRGYSWCRFRCGVPDQQMGSCDLTDGVWVWPQGLSHYLRVHAVTLPPAFVEHARRGGEPFAVPERSRQDDSLWIEWARPRRDPAFRQRLAEALEEDRRTAEEEIRHEIERLTQERGESDAECRWAGCPQSALNGGVFCGRHSSNWDLFVFRTGGQRRYRNVLRGG